MTPEEAAAVAHVRHLIETVDFLADASLRQRLSADWPKEFEQISQGLSRKERADWWKQVDRGVVPIYRPPSTSLIWQAGVYFSSNFWRISSIRFRLTPKSERPTLEADRK